MAKWLKGHIAKLSRKINLTIEQLSNVAILNNSRKFLAHIFWPRIIGYLLTFVVVILAVFFLHGRLFPENEQVAVLNQAVLIDPFNPQPHLSLGEYYLTQGYLQQTRHELTLATQLGSPTAGNLYIDIHRKKEQLQQQASFWESQLKDKPDFRDGYIKLAAIYYQLRDLEKAKQNLEKARQIDPNYEPTQKLEELLN